MATNRNDPFGLVWAIYAGSWRFFSPIRLDIPPAGRALVAEDSYGLYSTFWIELGKK